MLKKLGRIFILIVAVLVILLSLAGIFSAWGLSNVMSNATLKVFSMIQGGVGIADSATGRVDTLILSARDEVQQAGETITAASSNLQENKPVLTALNDRLETRLGPTVDNIQGTLAPVKDALITIDNAVTIANSMPFIRTQTPGLEKLEATFDRLSTLSADVQQLRTTLRTSVTEQTNQLTEGLATVLTDLTSRIDSRLAEVQTDVQELQSDITALQARIQTLQSRLLLIFDLFAVAATLLLIWVIYSQVVVIRHHWSRPVSAAPGPDSLEQGTPPDSETPGIEPVLMAVEDQTNVETFPTETAEPSPPSESSDSEA